MFFTEFLVTLALKKFVVTTEAFHLLKHFLKHLIPSTFYIFKD